MRKAFYPETFVFMEPGKNGNLQPVQVGLHKTKTFRKVAGKSKPVPVFSVPVYKGAPASIARYARAQLKRLKAGKRCNVTPDYVK